MKRFYTLFVIFIILLELTPRAVSQDEAPAPGLIVCSACRIDENVYGTDENANTRIPPPPMLKLPPDVRTPYTEQPQFEVTYTGFSPEAEAAFQYAVEIWGSILQSPVPIRIDAKLEVIESGVLGNAAVDKLHNVNGMWFPDALADALAGYDKNPGRPDMYITFNSYANWYFGTDGYTPSNRYDFVTVVLHEIGHGLGFISEAWIEIDASATWVGLLRAGDPAVPGVYDSFVVNSSGTSILTFEDPSVALLQQLIHNDLFWNGTNGVTASSGKRPKLYAPALWDEGSSYSHLSEATYPAGTLNSLMTSAASYAEAIHDPGPIALGMLADMGWTLNAAPVFRDGATTTRSIAENTLANQDVGKPVSATDVEDTTLIYALSGDPDAAAFDIDSTSGQLKTKAALDYETKNTYLVTITAGDSRQRASTIYVTITVDNVNEAPAFASGTVTLDIPEGTAANTNIGSPVFATDPDDGDTLSYTLGGPDASSFTIDPNTGQLATEAALDYETTSTYTVTVTATDTGNLSDTVTVTINITDVDEIATVNNAPIFTEGGSTMRAVAEHTPSGVAFDNPVFAIDPDGDTLSYTLGGTDAAAFRIVSSSGQLQTYAPLDYETKDTYTVTITASDGSLADTVSVSINVIDVISPIRSRTPQVRDIIVAVVPGISLEDDVTEADLAAITSLNLGDRRITALKAGDFDGLTALDKLYLNDNSLRELPDGIFSDLTALTHLTLKNNALSTLPAGVFSGLTSLTTLYLHNNNLSALPSGVFSGLTSLTTLELQNNALRTLPSGIFSGLTSLTELQLYSNALRTLPASVFSGLIALDELKLSGNNLSSLPEDSFSGLTSLTKLYLHFNALSTLPAGIFSGLTDLESLALSSNNLSSLPAGVFSGLIALDELTLSRNNLSSLPAGVFSGLTSLTKLYLYNNNLSSLPAGIFSDLTALFILSLSNNAVDPLPLTVSLEKVMEGQFKAVMPTGAPFEIVLPVSVGSNGSISGGASTLTIPKYHLESESLTVTRTPGTAAPVTVDIGALPRSLPVGHYSYNLVKSDDLPLAVISETTGNMAPTFTEGETASREIAEETASGVNIGAAVSAIDPNNDTLIYTLGGTDAAAFRIVSSSGQLQTDAALDYETKNTYSVTVTVSDGSLTDTIAVIINVPYVSALIGDRTPQVRDAILDAVPGVSSEDDITKAHLAAITSLDLRYRGITALKIGDFDGLTALTTLDLYSANFSTLPAGIFDDLTALTELDLSHTNLSSLPVGVFSGLTSLTTLKLNNNRAGPLRSLPAGIFSGLTSLTYLNLHSNWLSSLPSDIFSDLTSLTYLNLSYNGNLRSLPAFIFSGLTSLETLHLYGNLLSSLPDGIFSGLTSLTYLSLSQNVLRSLPDGIFSDLTAIETLKLNGNKLSSLPDGIFDDLTVLTDLGLSSNALSSLPEGIFDNFTALTDLGLSSNALSSLPEGIFDNFTALTSLRLFDNNLSSLPVGIFSGMTALTYLYLYGNTVDPLPLTVSLEKVGEGEFKAVAPTGAPFNLVLSISANNGTIDGGATSITIPKGNVESGSLTVTRTPGTTAAVTVDIGDPLPGLPTETDTRGNPLHRGYALVKSDDLPLGIISAVGNSAPTFTETSPATRSVAENTASGINIGDPVSATDADNDTLTYTLLSGIDAASFRIVRSSGQLQTDAALDYETKNTYTVTVAVSDGNGGSDSITVTITVTDFISPIRDRTPEVRDAIVAAVPGVSSEDEVTEAHLAAITSLDLGWDGIKALKVGDFDGLTALEYLKLSWNDLSSLPEGIFSDLTALDKLDLNGNQLGSLPESIFSGLTALTYLNLNNNALRSLPAGIFSDLTALTELYLWCWKLSSLPEGIFDNLTALDELYLGDAFSSLPEGIFDNLTALTTLDLDARDLSTLPAGIFDNLTGLTQLFLSYNAFSSLPEGIFDNLTALTYLNLGNNALSSLPEGVFSGLTSLESLWLQDNAVNPLPLPVSLEKVGEGEFKAVMPTGAPFEIVLPLTVMNGSIDGRATGMTIPKSGAESGSLTVTRPVGTTAPVTVNIGDPLPGLPTETNTQGNALHRGYALVKSDDLPLTVIDAVEADSPTVTIGVPSGTQTGAFDATITFSETVSDFEQADVSLSGSAASITAWRANSDNTVYTATITPAASGTVTISVAADVATNTAGNPNTEATSQTVTVDIDSPTVSIGVPSGTQIGAFDATITFSETVSGFEQADVSLTGSAASIIGWSANSDNTVYTATITPTASGTVTISVAANVATDAAGNLNTAATSKTVTVSVDTDAPGVSISVPSGVQTGAFSVTITFTESVSDFVQADLSLTGTASATITAWNTTDNTTYTATITPTTSGDVTLGVAANVATDAANNPNTAATLQTVSVDVDSPMVTIGVPSGTQTGAFDVTLIFTEAVSDFTQSDVSLTGSATSITAWSANSDNTVYTATITPTASGTVTVGVAADVATDAAGNPNTEATSQTVSVDVDKPTVSIGVPSGTQTGAFDATVTFSETVSGFEQADVSLSGSAASIAAWIANSDNSVYTATITPTASGTVTVGVAVDVATDAAGNLNTAATSKTVTVDVDAPTVSIGVPSGTQTGAFEATITFSETVSGFTQSDVSLTGSAASITGWSANSDNTVYTATITPTASGTVTVGVAADVATDAAGNPNTEATSQTVTIEIPRSIPDPATWMPDADLRSAIRSALGLATDATFSQSQLQQLTKLWASQSGISNITGLEYATNLTTLGLWGNSITNLEPIKDLTKLTDLRLSGNGLSDVSPLGGLTALTKLALQNNNIVDVAPLATLVNLTWLRLADNPTTDFSSLVTLVKVTDSDVDLPDPDTTAPGVSISVPSGVQNGAFDATITFTESVSDFVQADLGLSGAASVTGWNANNDNSVYTATITPTASGTVTVSVAANVATDAANNPNTAATSQTVTADVDKPSVTINVPSGVQTGAFNVTITFTETVSGFTQSDVSLSGSTASITSWSANSNNTVYTATITPTASGTVTVSVAANVATDAAGNPNTAATSKTVTIDVDRPTVSIGVPSGVQTGAFNATITFSEPVSGFVGSDVSLSGSAASVTDWSANSDNTVYAATITPTASGTVMVSVAANVATDTAGNPNTAATSQSVTVSVDTDPPGVSISVPSGVRTGVFDATITFTESVSGFTQSDLSLSGTATASITAWNTSNNTVYTATITATTSGTVTLNVNAGVATDTAGNPNTAATSKAVTVDIDKPSVTIGVPSGTQTGAFDATITFTETVSGFVGSDVSLTGSAAGITGWRANSDNTVYTATITPTASGTVTISIAANVATDAAGNPNTAATAQTVTIEIPPSIPDPATWMPDANLRSAVRSALGLATDATFTQAQLGQLTKLFASQSGISDITGLEHATELTKLSLWRNSISNLAPIKDLTSLTYLRLARNGISDVSLLSGLTALDSLGLQHNSIVNVAPLATLINLTWLRLAGNSITDLSPLVTLVNVTDSDVDLPDPDTTAPGVSISVPSGVQIGAFNATITFSEPVSGFVDSDVPLTSGAASITSWSANSNNTVYTATITPTASGTVTVSVAANAATDVAGNPNTAAASQTVTVDIDRPTATIGVPSGMQTGVFSVTITFTETVSGFVSSDVSLSGSTASITAWRSNSSNTVYTATITPAASGTVTLNVSSGVATDAAGNPNTVATSRTVTVDVDRPTVTIGVPSGTQTGAFNTTITFSEIVLGFTQSDVSLSGSAASITDWSANSNNTLYTATITPTVSGTVTVSVAADVAADSAGNSNTAATSKTVTVSVDTDPPGVSISAPSSVQNSAFNATITFTEAVSGFVGSDVSLTGSAANITGWSSNSNNSVYTATITPTASGTMTISIAANVATDAANNPNTAATPKTVTVDVDKPSVTIGVPSGTQTGAFSATITFTETVSGFVGSDVSLTGSAASITGWRANSNNTVYTATITPTASGTVTVSVAANVATDAANNPNTAATSKTVTVSVDTNAPGVSISVPSGVQNGAFNATITFTETVSGFTQSDVSLTGSAADITAWSANSNNTVYTTTITPTASGTVTVSVAANVATDAANNPNTAATPKTVSVDIDRPTVTIGVPSGTQTGAFDTTITFSETVSGFVSSDVSLTGSAASITAWSANSGNTVYTATITPTASGTVTLNVNAGVATDAANNPNTAATPKTVSVDIDRPTVTIGVPSGTQTGAFDTTITFSETVSGFTQSEVSLTGSAASITAWSAISDKTVFTATITPTASGTVTISVAANVATDAANNPNTAATSQTVTIALPEVTPDPVTSWMPDANLRAAVRKELGLTDNETLTQAKMLDVGILEAPDSQIADLTGLEYATNLKYLILDRNNISNLTPLRALTKLEELKLGRNNVSDVSPLGGITTLERLRLTRNNVMDATPLRNLVNLEWLRIKGNKNITNLHVLAGLPKLTDVDITIPDPPIGPQLRVAPARGEESSPPQTLLLPNYPNPFNPDTWIPYHLANDTDVQITIYDARGAVIRRLALGHQRAGVYQSRRRAAYWDGTNETGARVSSGIYFYQLQADNVSRVRKMVILK